MHCLLLLSTNHYSIGANLCRVFFLGSACLYHILHYASVTILILLLLNLPQSCIILRLWAGIPDLGTVCIWACSQMIVLVYKRTYIKTQHWRNSGSLPSSLPLAHQAVGCGREGSQGAEGIWCFLRFCCLKEYIHGLWWSNQWRSWVHQLGWSVGDLVFVAFKISMVSRSMFAPAVIRNTGFGIRQSGFEIQLLHLVGPWHWVAM